MSQTRENRHLRRLSDGLASTAEQITTAQPEQNIQGELRTFFDQFTNLQQLLDEMMRKVVTSLPGVEDPDAFSVTPEAIIALATKKRMHAYLHGKVIILTDSLLTNGPIHQFEVGQPHQLLKAIAWLNSF